MRDGGLVSAAHSPAAEATNYIAERASDPPSKQRKYSRELRGITDRRHFQRHPQYNCPLLQYDVHLRGSFDDARNSGVHKN